MRVLIGCECSGVIRDAFRAVGADAFSCDIQPDVANSPFHIQADLLSVLGDGWDIMIAHPPCTFLCSSGMHWTTRGHRPVEETTRAIEFAERLWMAPIPKVGLENPVGCLSTRSEILRHIKPQYIQPYQFGDNASKRTGLWLRGLPPLIIDAAQFVKPRMVTRNGKTLPRWANQTDGGQNKLTPSATRAQQRATTYPGIAKAMAEQWGRQTNSQLEAL